MSSEQNVESWIAKVNKNVKKLEKYYKECKLKDKNENCNVLLEALTNQIGHIKMLFEEDMKRIEEEIKEGKEGKEVKKGAFSNIKQECLNKENKNVCENLRKRFITLYNQISEYKLIETKVKSKTKKINDLDYKYVNKFIEKMKTKDKNEFEELSLILKEEITSKNIDKYKEVIKSHFMSLEPNTQKYPNFIRINWIINGFLNDNNRMIKDWFSRINSLFQEYDTLPNKQINFNESGGSGGLNEIEKIIENYNFRKGTAPFEYYGKNEVELIYNDEDLLVVAPTSQRSCIYWGYKTKWCVSRYKPGDKDPFEQNLFFDYYKNTPESKLYIIIFKKYEEEKESNDKNKEEHQHEEQKDEEVNYEYKEYEENVIFKDINSFDINKINPKNKIGLHFKKLQFMNYKDDFIYNISYEREKILLNFFKEFVNNSNNEESLLLFSSKFNLINVLEYLIKNKSLNINYEDENKRTSLMYASYLGHLNIVQCLVENGANVNHEDKHKCTSLIEASKKKHLKVIEYLIEKNADVNHKEENGITSLMFSCEEGSLDIVKCLVKNNADIEYETPLGWTSLMYAAHNGYLNIVKFLVKNKADIKHKNKNGNNSIILALRSKYFEIVEYLIKKINNILIYACKEESLEIIEYLVENGADVNEKDNDGMTCLMWASIYGYLTIAEYLVENNADVNEKDNNGITSLMIASLNGHLNIVEYLVENGANVNEKNNLGNTSLDYACIKGHLDIIEYLVEKVEDVKNRADVNNIDNNGWSSLMWAIKNQNISLLYFLVKNGAVINIDCVKLASTLKSKDIYNYLRQNYNLFFSL
jgi:ankyrin repeat protein